MTGSADDLRRRVMGWRVAERREQAVLAETGPMDSASAWNAALELYDLLPGDFRHADATRLREVELARCAWRSLRMHLTRR
jgi:hypothetical protein